MLFDLIGGDGGMLEEVVEEWEGAGHFSGGIGDLLAGGFAEGDDFTSGGDGIAGDGGDAAEEEFDPAFPVARAADGSEAVIVFQSVELEVVGEVEEGELEDIAVAEEEGDEEAADAAIAIEEGVDGFELGVRVGAVDEGGEIAGGVEEFFQIAEGLSHFVDGWRDVGGILEGAASGADPVLGAAEFSGVSLAAACAGHELGVDFTDEAEGEREGAAADLGKAVGHGLDIVDDFFDVFGRVLLAGFVVDNVFEGALGALDLGREDGLVTDIHRDEEIGAGKDRADAIESAEGAVGIG